MKATILRAKTEACDPGPQADSSDGAAESIWGGETHPICNLWQMDTTEKVKQKEKIMMFDIVWPYFTIPAPACSFLDHSWVIYFRLVLYQVFG